MQKNSVKKRMLFGLIGLLVFIALVFALRPRIPYVYTPFETAWEIGKALEAGKEELVLRTHGEIDPDSTYEVLEAIYPYAFSLELTAEKSADRLKVCVKQEMPGAREQVGLLAEQIVRQETAGIRDEAEKARVLHDYVVRNVRYDAETAASGDRQGTSLPFTAYGALVHGEAVCAGYARAYMLLCREAGLQVLYIADEEMNHAWNALRIDGRVYYVDCTYDDPLPDRGDYAARDFCLLTADGLSRTHRWDRMFYGKIMDFIWGPEPD